VIHPYHVCSPATTLANRRTTSTTSTSARRASLLALAVGLAVSAGAQAVNTSRTGNGDWYDATRWNNGVPTATNSWAYVDGYTLSLQTAGARSWQLYLGNSADAHFDMSNGATLDTATATLGAVAGHRGSAVLSGARTSWDIQYDIGVGHLGRGELSVLGGAHLYTNNAWVGSMPGSTGFVQVDGATSRWDAGTIYAGAQGTGRVEITNGAKTVSDKTILGWTNTGVGTVVVSGTGSHLTATDLQVGAAGMGELIVQGGAGLLSTTAVLGAGGTGVATINNATSQWINDGLLTIGSRGHGDLQVYNGASVVTHGLLVATQGGSGMLTIGADAGVDNSGATATFGDSNAATINVGGLLVTDTAILGRAVGSFGEVLVNGPTARWISNTLQVGQEGIGTFSVDNGATASVSGSILLAADGTARGSLLVGNNATLAVGNSAGIESIRTGDGTGSVELAGGLLRSNGWVNLDSDVLVSVSSQLDTVGNLGIQGDISGTGALRKTGAGVLMLSGANSFSGGLQIDAGTLSLNGAASAGRGGVTLGDGTSLGLVNMTTLVNSVRLLGNAGVWVPNGTSVTFGGGLSGVTGAVLEKNDGGELVLSNGAFSGLTRVNGGTVRAIGNAMPSGDIEIGSAGRFQTDTTRVVTYAGRFSGNGQLQQGRHFLTLTGDSSAFSGTTVVDGGQLAVEGALGGTVQLGNTAWLTGNGRLGDVEIRGGSTLSPGSNLTGPVGRLSITGNLVFDSSAIFNVDVAANGSSDHVDVAGTATLGQANTVALASAGEWAPSTRYTLLTANDGVEGRFAGATSTLAFLAPTLDYDANHVYLTLARNDIAMPDIELAFPDVVVNTNQKQVAGAVEALGAGNAVYDAVVRLEVPQVVPAFDSLGGEIHAAARTALLQDHFLRDGIHQRLDGAAMSGVLAGNTGVWVAGSGNSLRLDADGVGARSRVQQQGLMAGADWRISERVLLGVAVGEQTLTNRLDDRQAKADADATEYGVYSQFQGEHFSLRGGVSRTDYRIDTTREVTVGSTMSQSLAARSDATADRMFARAGWNFTARTVTLTPEIELAHVRLRSEQVAETGGSSALQVQANRDEVSTGVAALRAVWGISGGQRDRAALTARVGWQYAEGDLGATMHARFNNGSTTFAMQSVPLARSMGLAELGVAVSPTTASRLSLQAQTSAGDGQRDVGAQLNWSVQF
jgi:autotransporter-associated beta strand protein/T5SS/PEP-CTERM-associated repeat protein